MRPEQAKPVVHLLAGLPGSGKSTYAKTLEKQGAQRLSVDDRVLARHGLLGRDYPPADHFTFSEPILAEIREELAQLVRAGRTVVLDHALDRRSDRDDFKTLILRNGGRWQLHYFKADRGELLRRLTIRNATQVVGQVTPEMLDWMIATWEEPADEGEITVSQPTLVTVQDHTAQQRPKR
jgi:predicted kinase